MASLGQELREEREGRHISIEEIASATKIVSRYLKALESDHLDIMPGEFFIKGIIRAYSRAIGLDGEAVLAKYKAAGLIGEPERKRHLPLEIRTGQARGGARCAPCSTSPARTSRSSCPEAFSGAGAKICPESPAGTALSARPEARPGS